MKRIILLTAIVEYALAYISLVTASKALGRAILHAWQTRAGD